MLLQVRVRDTDNDRLYSFELTEQLLSGSQVEAWKEIAAKTLAEGGDEAERKPIHPLKGTHETGRCNLIFKDLIIVYLGIHKQVCVPRALQVAKYMCGALGKPCTSPK